MFQEKQKIARQLETSQEKASELKSKASAASIEKDRLFQEKMDLNNKYQQLLVNKEQLDRVNNCIVIRASYNLVDGLILVQYQFFWFFVGSSIHEFKRQ